MYKTEKKYFTPEMKMSDLICENPKILLLNELFGIDFIVNEKNISQLCEDSKVSLNVFIAFTNLYNGFSIPADKEFTIEDIPDIIKFLRNSHEYYENEKYPEIKSYVKELYSKNNLPEIELIDKFFDDYFEEVKEHLSYEDKTVFPYFNELVQNQNETELDLKRNGYSVKDYREHHTDIESKLNDLKKLLLKHVPVQMDRALRRKIVLGLSELENDLNLHSIIEETVLTPLIDKLEKRDS